MAAAAALPQTMEATTLRDSLQKSQGNTEGTVTILGSFDHRLSALEAAMRPTQVRTHAIRMAHENVDKTLKVQTASSRSLTLPAGILVENGKNSPRSSTSDTALKRWTNLWVSSSKDNNGENRNAAH